MAKKTKSSSTHKRPLQVVGWLSTSGHQTVISSSARDAAARSNGGARTKKSSNSSGRPKR